MGDNQRTDIEPIEWVTECLLLVDHNGVLEGEKYSIYYKDTEYNGVILFTQDSKAIFETNYR
jgi:hypothetical protein